MNTRISMMLFLPAAMITVNAPAQAENFEGPFVGVEGGYSRDDIGPDIEDDIEISEDLDRDAAYFQLFAGYDHAVADKVRLGVEAAIGIGADDELSLSDGTDSVSLDPEFSFELTGRAGYLVGENTMLYARGGYHSSRVELTITEEGTADFQDKGYVEGFLVGGGFEHAFGDNLRSRIEYRYSDLGSNGANWDRHQVLAGVLYNF